MPLPMLSTDQIEWVVHRVVQYIDQQRQTYRSGAAPLTLNQKNAMRPFFSEPALDSTRLVMLTGQRVKNPPFYGGLVQMGFEAASLPNFAFMVAVTFVDTVVSREAFTDRLLFHELAHVVQYEKLGLEGFADKYVRDFLSGGSYDGIPLEINACELNGRFAAAPTKAFSVADEVRQWLDAGKL